MKQLFDQIDQNGNIIIQGMLLLPGITLPEGHQWVPHTPSLEHLKAEKRLYIENQRNLQCFKPVYAIGYLWQADKRSQDLLNQAILLGQSNALQPTVWRTLDNIDVPVTLDDLKTIAAAIGTQTQLSYQKQWELKALLDNCQQISELDSIVWS